MCKWTKGPWTTKGFHPYLVANVGPNEVAVMRDTPDSGGGPFYPAISEEERDANARLIAAAPDLAEALEELLWAIANTPDTPDNGEGAKAKARAALARAKGE